MASNLDTIPTHTGSHPDTKWTTEKRGDEVVLVSPVGGDDFFRADYPESLAYRINQLADKRLAELEDALAPFALYSSQFTGRDDIAAPVLQADNQTLCIGAFQTAREAMGLDGSHSEPDDKPDWAEIGKLTEEIATLTGCRDHWKASFDHERANVIRLRGLLAVIHSANGAHCTCADCQITRQKTAEAPAQSPLSGAPAADTPGDEAAREAVSVPQSRFITPEAQAQIRARIDAGIEAIKNREEDDSE